MARTKLTTTTKPKKTTIPRQLVQDLIALGKLPEKDVGAWEHLLHESARTNFSFDDSPSFTPAGNEIIQQHLDALRQASEAKEAEEKERQTKDKKLRQKQASEAKKALIQEGYAKWLTTNDPKDKSQAELNVTEANLRKEINELKRTRTSVEIGISVKQKALNAYERESKRLKKAAEKAEKKEATKAAKKAIDRGAESDSSDTDDDETEDENPSVEIQPVEMPSDLAQQTASN